MRASDESTTLQMASTLAPGARATSMATRVSSVSPDWLTPMTRVCSSTTGFRYRNSEEMSISTGNRAQCSMAYLAIRPAW